MAEATQKPHDDVVFVESSPAKKTASPAEERLVAERLSTERRPAERAVVGMRGRYTLNSWRDADGNLRAFSCSVAKMSSRAIELSAPVTGAVGEWVCVHFEKFGKFEGPIIRNGQRSLVMRIVATVEETNKVADKIAWIENKGTADSRRHERFVPFDPNSTVVLADGSILPCRIIDYSISGAAVSVDLEPDLGAVLKVGKVIGRVVRTFAGGFAVEFAVIQQHPSVENLVTKHAVQSP
jgi:PilZ domain-containing protein